MCGIFGIFANEESDFTKHSLEKSFTSLFLLSESRGKEAAGLALAHNDQIQVFKSHGTPSALVNSKLYKNIFSHSIPNGETGVGPIAMVGHSRMVTNGTEVLATNNQPVVSQGIVGVHNGIVVNDSELWKKYPQLEREFEIDSEVILQLLRHHLKSNPSLKQATQQTFQDIQGMASIAVLFEELRVVLLASNNGSLYYLPGDEAVVFASENFILKNFIEKTPVGSRLKDTEPVQLLAGTGLIIDLDSLQKTTFPLTPSSSNETSDDTQKSKSMWEITNLEDDELASPTTPTQNFTPGGEFQLRPVPNSFDTYFQRCKDEVSKLQRCSKCVLPETMPFIEFNKDGVCNYCTNYTPIELAGKDAFATELAKYKKDNDQADCTISLSGGRDSSYGLHYVVQEMGMKPVAYTYDWGMVTDLARRNISRMCGQLGIEHILISADIPKKRSNIRKNVSAWLKKPELGLIPLFMAGDKQFFYYANVLKKQFEVDAVIFSENRLETTYFKSGFCGIKPQVLGGHTYTLPTMSKIGLAAYYAQKYLENPRYLNSSVWDTLHAYFSYYIIPHDFVWTYNYVPWIEEDINKVLIDEYEWETATDTDSTWRIGDGTASFYNYIYYVVAGLSENDTFRSNQIREGMITREYAMEKITEENVPRWETIQWYCDIIGIDFEDAIRTINKISPLYRD